MGDESTLIVTDQLERELIWDALADYRGDPEYDDIRLALIERVSMTFRWVRDGR